MNVYMIVLLLAVSSVLGIDRARLAQTPPAVANFDLDRWDGEWFLQWRFASCLWRGSDEFDDWVQDLTLNGDRVEVLESWFNDVCAETSAVLRVNNDTPGVFVVKDTFGNVWSGDQIVVATDYNNYSVSWGCTKTSVDGTCADPWVTVKTRSRNVGIITRGILEGILRFRFGLSLNELRRIPQNNRCLVIGGE